MPLFSKPSKPSPLPENTLSRPVRHRNPSAKAAALAAATPRPRRKPAKKAVHANTPQRRAPSPEVESEGNDSDEDVHYIPSNDDTVSGAGSDWELMDEVIDNEDINGSGDIDSIKGGDNDNDDDDDDDDKNSSDDDGFIAVKRVYKNREPQAKYAQKKAADAKAPKPLVPSTTARGPPRTPATFHKEKVGAMKTPPVLVTATAKRTNDVLSSDGESGSLPAKKKVILEFGPKPAKAAVKLEKKLTKHLQPSPLARTVSDDDIDDNDDEPTIISAPAVVSITDQSYWKKTRPTQWPALVLAIIHYKINLITRNPFADASTLRDYALQALQDAFEVFEQFEIAHGMVEMIMSTTYSYRGNFKVNSTKNVPALYQLATGNAQSIKEHAELALRNRNYRFFTFGLPPDDSSKTRHGFCEHPSLPLILSPIFVGKKKSFWDSPEGQAIITTKIEPNMDTLCAFGLTVTHAMLDEWVTGIRIKTEMTTEKYGQIFQEHLGTVKQFKIAKPHEWETVSSDILREIMDIH